MVGAHKYQFKSNFQKTSKQSQMKKDLEKKYKKGNKCQTTNYLLMSLINLSLIKLLIIRRQEI